MKVLFMANIPSPYRVDFFNELGKLCNLTVTFEGKNATDRDTHWIADAAKNFRSIFMKGIRTRADQFFCPEIIKIVNETWDYIIVGNYSSVTSMLAIEYMKSRKIQFIIEADGGLINENERKSKFIVKRHFISSARYWLSSGKATDDYFVYYGAERERCFTYPFTSLRSTDLDKAKKLSSQNKRDYREKLSMSEKHIMLSVGRFSYKAGYGKGYDLLMRAAEILPDTVGLYIVGDAPTEEFINWKRTKNLKHVHFIGFKDKRSLLNYYAAADLFVLMTRYDVWGLVINEAMAFGLPVITTTRCVAGLELIENGKNGYLIRADDVNALTNRINRILQDEPLKKSMMRNNLIKIRGYTIESMANRHMQILETLGK